MIAYTFVYLLFPVSKNPEAFAFFRNLSARYFARKTLKNAKLKKPVSVGSCITISYAQRKSQAFLCFFARFFVVFAFFRIFFNRSPQIFPFFSV